MYGEVESLEGLVGKEFDFYGVDNLCFKLGDQIFEAVENEDDGYRSYLGSVEVRDRGDLIFPRLSFARVRLEDQSDYNFSGYAIVGVADGHVWLCFGTDNMDDYYPCFTFEYQAKAA